MQLAVRIAASRRLQVSRLLLVLLASLVPVTVTAEEAGPDWLRGSGDELELRLRGEVLRHDGTPAAGFNLRASLRTSAGAVPLQAVTEGHRWVIWVPVNKYNWHAFEISAVASEGSEHAAHRLDREALRQAAMDGVKLELQSPPRRVEVQVTAEGKRVAGAFFKVSLLGGPDLQGRTNAEGVAEFGLLAHQSVSGLTAWTDDFQIGGYVFYRTPRRDPTANSHLVELSRCRPLKLRFVDESAAPVPGLEFLVHVATPAPHFNFIGINDNSRLKTNASGEAIYDWFPQWEEHYFYADLISDQWVLDREHTLVEGVVVYKVKRTKDRRRVTGTVSGALAASDTGGFFVQLQSFQGEQENTLDRRQVFTDPDGSFSTEILPDARYVAHVSDCKLIGESIDFTPYVSATGTVISPELKVVGGQSLQIVTTSGPNKKPLPNVKVSVRREHEYTWRGEKGLERGIGGPQVWITTDDSGRAVLRTVPGKHRIRVSTPTWQENIEIQVDDQTPVVHLHRAVDAKRKITGRLVLTDGCRAELEGAEIQVVSVDGTYPDKQVVAADRAGDFSFETQAEKIAVFASTRDGRGSGLAIVEDLSASLRLEVLPTIDYHGQLLGDGDQPLTDYGARASIRIHEMKDRRLLALHVLKELDAKTDRQGNFTIPSVPRQVSVLIGAFESTVPKQMRYLDEVYLEADEVRPRAVYRIAKTPVSSASLPLAERYQRTLRDCALSGFHLMVILSDNAPEVTTFVQRNLLEHESNRDVASYMQLNVSPKETTFSDADRNWLAESKLPIPTDGRVFACVHDSRGQELGRIEIDVTDPMASAFAAKFLSQHAPQQVDAEAAWRAAFDEAKRSQRRVWARISQRYCGPCFLLARWMDDHRQLLEKDFVMLKIDDVRDRNGTAVAERLLQERQMGVPFHAMFNADEQLLIDSAGPIGNIGFPSGFEGKKQLRKMLQAARTRLSDKEIDQLVASLSD